MKNFISSYSASGGALLEAWRFCICMREWFAESFCKPIYEAVIDQAVELGRLEAPGYAENPFIYAAYLSAD